MSSPRGRGNEKRRKNDADALEHGNSGDVYEQAVVKLVPSQGSGQALSQSKGRSRDFFAGIPHIDSASGPESGCRLLSAGCGRMGSGVG
jgi:hypothetical protein